MDSQNSQPRENDPLGARSAAALRDLQDRAKAAVAGRREKAAQLEAEITARLESVSAAVEAHQRVESSDAHDANEAQVEIKRLETALEDAQSAAQLERAAWESEREALESQRRAAEAEQATFKADRATWESERTELVAKLAALEANQKSAEIDAQSSQQELRTAQDESRRQVAEFERQLLDAQAAHDRDKIDWADERAKLARQGEELRQKFDLALEDVQRFRSRVADLEQELARRPQVKEADSAELVALRAERDALAARIEQLEREPAVRVDADTEQQLADLQRRFEMAVEDVRELKTKNAKLESQLLATKSDHGAAATPDAGGMDWESQKRRLLANLEDGDEESSPEAQKERATIESTIEITDAVVAEKDREIEELKAQLVDAGSKAAEDTQREAETAALIDADEVIAQHRKNIAQIERELEAKLRAAELELSVERAKIARNRAELEDLRNELESQRHAMGTSYGPQVAGAPKRRWLSKLGLAGEEDA